MPSSAAVNNEIRFDWTVAEAEQIMAMPFHDLLFEAHKLHRDRHEPHVVEAAMLLSIKTGACPEDCAYCSQSARNDADLGPEPLMKVDDIVERVRRCVRLAPPDRLSFAPDCGLSQTARWAARQKLANMVAGVRAVREEL